MLWLKFWCDDRTGIICILFGTDITMEDGDNHHVDCTTYTVQNHIHVRGEILLDQIMSMGWTLTSQVPASYIQGIKNGHDYDCRWPIMGICIDIWQFLRFSL